MKKNVAAREVKIKDGVGKVGDSRFLVNKRGGTRTAEARSQVEITLGTEALSVH